MYQLAFSPVYDYATFLKMIDINARGVYVWGFKNPVGVAGPFEHFLPYYVGKGETTTIYKRIHGHYNLNANYHIFLSKYLHEYYKYLKTDAAIKLMSPQQYNIYKSYFAYLNADNSGKAINELDANNASIKPHTNYYQQYFHVCYIPVDDDNAISTSNLEKHINFHIPHILIGKSIAKHDSSIKICTQQLAADNFYYNYNVKGF